jgi:hypothetical protein
LDDDVVRLDVTVNDALPVRDRERGEFWRYMSRVLISHHDKFTQAMMLAAMGYHFRKLTEGYNQ